MSQYPSPYQIPPPPAASPYAGVPYGGGYGGPPSRASAAAQRAGLMLFILGPLLLLAGGCFGVVGGVLGANPSSPEWEQLRSQTTLPPGVTFRQLGAMIAVFGIGAFALGGTLLGLAVFVRRGRKGPTVAATVVVGLALLLAALNLLTAAMHLGAPNAAGGVCVSFFAIAAFGLQLAWLIAALRSPPGAGGDAYQQYLAQWYQYQQNAQAYAAANGGYGQGGGYGAPPVVDPPQPPPAPPQG